MDVIILVWLRVVLPTLVSKCFVVNHAENVLLWTAVSLLFILTKTNPNEIEMDENYTPYNHKRTKIDGVEPKHRGTPATKRGLSN